MWNIGTIDIGEEKIIKYSYIITTEQTRIQPDITGNYANSTEDKIEKSALPKVITVRMPDKFVDIELRANLPEKIYAGTDIVFSIVVVNNGTAALRSYTLTLIEKNMVIASEGKLGPTESKSFNSGMKCTTEKEITIKLTGKNDDTGDVYEKTFTIPIEVLDNPDVVTPTPDSSPTVTPPIKTNGPSDDDNVLNWSMILVLAVGIVAVILLVITIVFLIKSIVKKFKIK